MLRQMEYDADSYEAKIAGSEPLGLFDVAIQAVEICEQKRVVDAGYPTIFLAFQKPNRSADIPPCCAAIH